jgi:hypothetical protein
MDPFALVLFGGLVVFVVAVWLLGRLYPGSGLEALGLRSAREIIETREALEAEDLDEMVAARNARRRARGEVEVSSEEVELQVAHEAAEQERRRLRYVEQERRRRDQSEDDRDLDELLELTNARRRARGLPARTREDIEAELAVESPATDPPADGPER